MNAKDVEDMLKKYKLWLERKTFLLQWRTTLEPQNSMIAVREPEKNVIKRRIIDEEIEEKNAIYNKIEVALICIPEKYRILLTMRFVEENAWLPISIRLGYSCEYTRKELKEKALESLRVIMEDDER